MNSLLTTFFCFDFSGFTRDLSRSIELVMEVPEIGVRGPYSVDGRILILPITGNGIADIRLSKICLPQL